MTGEAAAEFVLTPEEALKAGIPREVIEAAWRETDALLGTNATDDLIRRWFGTVAA